jgi:SlyX protein
MNDERFETIETKLAYQEDLVAQLNEIITEQQVQLTRLKATCESLTDRMRTMSDGAVEGSPEDERPPHY